MWAVYQYNCSVVGADKRGLGRFPNYLCFVVIIQKNRTTDIICFTLDTLRLLFGDKISLKIQYSH
jgi:hypothetical protein